MSIVMTSSYPRTILSGGAACMEPAKQRQKHGRRRKKEKEKEANIGKQLAFQRNQN